MGSQVLEKIRSEALELSESERAELAYELVTSLDGSVDHEAANEWDAEILRRIAAIDAGTAKLIDTEEFRRRLRARVSGT